MLSENMPKCVCGQHSYSSHGGYCGPDLAYTYFKCIICGRYAIELRPWVFFSSESEDENILTDYINKVIIPLRRQIREKGSHLLPPQIPECIDVCERFEENGEKGWVHLNHKLSQDLPLPIDPIGVKHRECWKETVQRHYAHEIKNQYYDDHMNNQPWYEFEWRGATIQFGPRKRVIAINVKHSTHFKTQAIAEKAKEDNVTFSANHSWAFEKGMASVVTIHAWNKKKFDEYLEIILSSL